MLDDVISILLDLRKQARENKDFALSDLIRNRLAESGLTLKDTRDGTEWSISQR